MLQDLKTSTNDEERVKLQNRIEQVEGQITDCRREASVYEDKASGCKERLGHLKDEGKV